RFKDLADRKKHVFDEDISALVEDEVAGQGELNKVMALTVIAGTGGPQKAIITLDVDGRHETRESTSNGPVDATFNAIQAIVPNKAKLALFQVHAVTEGTDAQAEVSVRLEEEGKSVTARGADPDTLVAAAKAYVSANNSRPPRGPKPKREPQKEGGGGGEIPPPARRPEGGGGGPGRGGGGAAARNPANTLQLTGPSG